MNIIAEIGSNWRVGSDDESRKRASQLIQAAANNGATAVKFQLFRANELYRHIDKQKQIIQLELPEHWLPELKQESEQRGMEFLCTPFFLQAVDILENIDISRYKIASSDLTYTPLLEKIALTEKPVILSTAGATFDEIEDALITLRPNYREVTPRDITLMHCTGGYPTVTGEAIISRILELASQFIPMEVGYSSHLMLPHVVAGTALYKVETFEVHFDLADKKGVETNHSYSPDMLQALVKMINDFTESYDCNCAETFGDWWLTNNARRDPSDWLRPPKEQRELK